VLAYFGTDVDWGKGAVGVDVDGVMGIGVEGGDKEWGCSGFEVLGLGNVVEELAVNKFLQGKPDVVVLFVMDHVLVRVVTSREARQGSEEILEGGDVDRRIKYRERSSSR